MKDPVQQIREAEEDVAAVKLNKAAALTPPFSAPLAARPYNVTVEMLARVIGDMSEGQVTPVFDKAKGQVDVVPPDVMMALRSVAAFTKDERIDPVALASDPDAFADLAGVLSSMRGENGNAKPESRSGPLPESAASIPELAAVDRRASAAELAGQLGSPVRARRGA
jgi:hypothetical protein